MPVHLTWHPTLPILTMTYQGVLSREEYRALCDERREMLDESSSSTVLLADTRELEGVEEIQTLMAECEDIFKHQHVRETVIVLPPSVYRSNIRAIRDTFHLSNVPVRFFASYDEALQYAESSVRA